MFSGVASLTLSSGLWLTAMAANPLGTEIARAYGVEIGFGSWLLASSVPTLLAMAVLPWVLYKVIAPKSPRRRTRQRRHAGAGRARAAHARRVDRRRSRSS